MGLWLLFYIVFLVCVVLGLISLWVGGFVGMNMDSLSSFECGFDCLKVSRFPFSLQFFLIAIIFLIFDVEIVIILPIPVLMGGVTNVELTVVFLWFSFVILGGLYYEWSSGCLSWGL